jgi:hypothetical protein
MMNWKEYGRKQYYTNICWEELKKTTNPSLWAELRISEIGSRSINHSIATFGENLSF